MATSAGFDSQVGYAYESPTGTYTAVTRAIEHVNSSLKLEMDRIVSKGIKAGRRVQSRWFNGPQRVKGHVVHELSPVNIGMLLKQGMGAVSTTGSNPYTHVFTPGATVQTTTLGIQVGTPDLAGTVQPFSFIGCHILGFEITSKIGEVAMIDLDIYGQHLDLGQSLVAASYASTWVPFTFAHGVLSLVGSEYEFDDVSFKAVNGLQVDRHRHRSTTPTRPKTSLEAGFREYSAVVNGDFHSLTALSRAIAGTETAFSLVFTNGSNTLTIAGNVRTDVDSPVVEGPDTVKHSLPLQFISTTSDAAACTITLVNADSAP